MIFIAVKWHVKDEYAQDFPALTREFTEATRAEPGNRFFEWSRSVEDPSVYYLVEAFDEGEAPSKHVGSAHFARAMADFPAYLVETPQIVSQQLDQDDWDRMGEMSVEG